MLSDQELSELKERCKYAASHGFQIALADHYVADLEDEAGEADYDGDKGTAAHLVVLIDAVEKVRAGHASKKKSSKAAAPPPPPSEPTKEEKSSKKGKKKDDED